ncbi:helix-turn-helix and ligand-binding sensor domain-containing protein [Hanstruepera ponticola]|uniref:helix-turn-helix and ligand-binding sensor domain-containing protein n=1 Tax=Hanstruepera ponticola TaxID=2042995 RepID=UPI000CF0DE66|nr:triple tyrosine motif-containing protein [Hanstruepera ponticola]
MKLNTLLLSVIGFLLYGHIFSQELPPIESYGPKNYDADNQNWDISQADNKYVYIANNRGLLEYNGSDWNVYTTPNKTLMRSVNVVGERIYTGCYMEFGYWIKDNFGTLNYFSLSSKIDEIIEDEEFWKIASIKHWVIFQSLDRIYIYDSINDTFNIIEPESTIVKMYVIENEVFFQVFDKGIFKIENGVANLVIDNTEIVNSRVVNMFRFENNYLILTSRKGFYNYSNAGIAKWNIAYDDELKNMTIYSAKMLEDQTILLGTISNGLVALNYKGEFKYHINQSKGLQNNTVLTIEEDVDENLWLGLDNGLNFIKSNSPYRIYYDYSGKLGAVYASIVFKNHIYIGTNQGLFYKKLDSDDDYELISNTNGQVWSLTEINDELFCGHDSGAFVIRNINEAYMIPGTQGTWDFKPLNDEANVILQGNYDGLNVLEKNESQWVLRNKIIGFDISSRYFELINDNTVFVSHEYKGVFKIKLDNSWSKAINVEKESHLEKGLNSSLTKYKGMVYYANQKGVFRFNANKSEFVQDSVLSDFYNDGSYVSGKLIPDNTGKLWNFSKYNLSYFDFETFGNKPELFRISLAKQQTNSMNGYENITHLLNQEYLIGTSNGYMIADFSKIDNNDSYQISINEVQAGKLDSELKKIILDEQAEFHNKTNNIFFKFSIPEYYRYSEKRFQYLLEGYNTDWSDWTTNTSQFYENLPSGDFTFRVKGKIGQIETKNEASYKFTIAKPWYLSDLFISIYIIGGLILLLIVHLIYRTYYRNQRKKLLIRTQKDIELKELENKQQLMTFKNEKLNQDIENKNRELAISTMSLIKKNEFLNNIKEELNKKNQNNNLNPIIKIIDKNLNNTNDWELFEEAFNNADKDFLKKVKSKHPALTHNDLRLCAYLRLNLSSKEIAPLLNISTRSVEVKRYRLRKKMELEHETSLTDYILQL